MPLVFASFPQWWFTGWKSRVHLAYCLSFAQPTSSALCWSKDSKMKETSVCGGVVGGAVTKMTGQCQNNSLLVIFVQRSFNMVPEMHIQYSLDLRSFSDGFHVWTGDWLAYNCLGHESSSADKDKKDILQRCEMWGNARSHIELTSCASKHRCPSMGNIWRGNEQRMLNKLSKQVPNQAFKAFWTKKWLRLVIHRLDDSQVRLIH